MRSTDFERVLRVAPRAKSAHFALHHVRGEPARFLRSPAPEDAPEMVAASKLCTGPVIKSMQAVDDSVPGSPSQRWLGTVVPKRHARRSVTRSLMKRQIHAAFERQDRLPAGLWVIRLRAAFDLKRFPSAASQALRLSVRQELDGMLADLMRRISPERIA